MRPIYKAILWIIGLSCFFILYHYFDPAHSHLAPKCPFWLLTGYHCPGCGSQRAIHAILNGHVWEGMKYNLLLVPGLVYVIVLIISRKNSKLHSALSSALACWIWLGVIMAWWIVRNLLGL